MLRYESGSTGESFLLSSENVKGRIKKAGFYDHEWLVDETKQTLGSVINQFKKEAEEYELTVDYLGDRGTRAENANRFSDMTERDVLLKKTGKLHLKDYYINCFVIGSESGGRDKRCNMVQRISKVYCPYPFWIKEVSKQFLIQTEISQNDGMDYEFDFPFDFTSEGVGHKIWNVDHYAPSHFKVIVYGPCKNPEIFINGYPYKVFAELEASDYMIIDSRGNLVEKHMKNGATVNLYNARQFSPSIFEKIPSGTLRIDWSGKFGFDIILYLERSAPKW